MVLDQGLSNQAKANAQKIANMGQLMHLSQPERDDARENLAIGVCPQIARSVTC